MNDTTRHFSFGDDFRGDIDEQSRLILLSANGIWWPGNAASPLLPPASPWPAELCRDHVRLGAWDGANVFACRLDAPALSGFRELPQRETVLRLETELSTLACMGRALLIWREHANFCPSCGAPLQDKRGERSRECTKCGRPLFPTVCPAVIIAVSKGDQLLLAHNSRFQDGMFGLIAGFVEAGENLEQAVAREIREEVGIEVTNIHYCSSQSWPYPASLMLGFTADYADGDLRPDGVEITAAEWFSPGSFPHTPRPGSLASTLITGWLQKHANG